MRDRAASGDASIRCWKLFSIVPDYDLQHHEAGAGADRDHLSHPLKGWKPVLESFKPDVVLVHGDTTTTMAASLAAFYQRIPVGHGRGRPAHRRFEFAVAGRRQPVR